MFEYHLVELDELLLTVRDRNSREHISEAIVAYRARAYRSALMSVWIAVAYDIIKKIRELQFNGDKAARDFVDKLDAAIALQQTDYGTAVKRLQAIENDLLKKASEEEFEFLSREELKDLNRLKQDRNLCAHPAFTADQLLFQPSPELVRSHITHAITHLLQHPPVQGKHALVRMKNDILQPSFPTTQNAVSDFLYARYLNRAKKSLINNLVTVFLKIILKQAEADLIGKENEVLMCLIAVQIRNSDIYEQRMSEVLPHLTDESDDNELRRVFRLFQADKRCWNWLSLPIRLKLIEITKSYSYNPADAEHVFSALEIDELRPHLLARVAALGLGEKKQLFSHIHRPEFVDEAIDMLASAQSFRDAEAVEEWIILPLCSLFRAEHVQRILQAAMENSQIHHASGSLAFFCKMFERTVDLHEQTADAWRTFLTAMSNGKDLNDPYAYSELRGKMSQAGILPA